MNRPDKELAIIILKSAYTSLTAEEQKKLSQFLDASAANRAKYEELIRSESLRQKLAHYARRNSNRDLHFQTILRAVNKKNQAYPLYFLKRYSWAAAALLLILAGWWLLDQNRRQPRAGYAECKATAAEEILPGRSGAVLTLADGSQLVLDNMKNGKIAGRRGADAVLNNGQLVYVPTGKAEKDLIFHTVSTPKGREFTVKLPDGTQVWLNSASSIRFPTVFAGEKRKVTLTGEAYFEVTHNAEKPFWVTFSSPEEGGGERAVEVLGTHFNINTYSRDSKITLLEGSVKVNRGNEKQSGINAVTLKPGQQAMVPAGNKNISVTTADTGKVMAWRRGYFNFDEASLEEVMQQLARWYNLEVVYEAGVPEITFAGELSRGAKLSVVLKVLENSKVHIRQEGRKLIIQP